MTRRAPAVAGLIKVEVNAITAQINNIGDTGTVDVSQPDTALIEQVGRVKPRRIVHGHLGAEATVAEVGPVADFAVANAHEVGQSVTGKIGEVDGLGAVGKNQPRPFFFVQRLLNSFRRCETGFRQRWIPAEGFVFADQNVGMAVSREIDKLEIGIVPVQNRQRSEGAERAPTLVMAAFVKSGSRSRKLNEVELSVAGQVEKLLAAAADLSEGRSFCDSFDGPEAHGDCFSAILRVCR